MPQQFQVQQHYGAAGQAVLQCDLPRYLAVLLRVAGVHEVSVAERNAAAATAYLLADDITRQAAFDYTDGVPAEWSELLAPLRQPSQVAICLFRDCCQVAWSDGDLDSDEREVLIQVACELHLADSVRDQILGAVEEQERARLRVLSLFV